MHALCRHILLSEHLSELACAVVAEVDEDDHVAFLNRAVDGGVVDRLDELVGHAFVVALLHGLDQVSSLLTLALDEQVVSLLDAVPALVAVHSVEAAYDAGDVRAVVVAYLLDISDESLAALRVSVTTVHEAVYIDIFEVIFFSDLDELEEVVEAGVHATGRSQSHQVELLAGLLSVAISVDDLLVLQDVACLAGLVDLHQVLIDDTSCTDVQVSYLGVAHLSFWQTDVLAAGHELRVSACSVEIIEIRCRCVVDHVTFAMLSDSPSIENHQ